MKLLIFLIPIFLLISWNKKLSAQEDKIYPFIIPGIHLKPDFKVNYYYGNAPYVNLFNRSAFALLFNTGISL